MSLASFPGPGSLLPAGRRGRRSPASGATFWKGLVSSHSPAVTCASLPLLRSFLLATRRPRCRVRRCLRFLPLSDRQASGCESPDIVRTRGRAASSCFTTAINEPLPSCAAAVFVSRLATVLIPPADTCSCVRPPPKGRTR